MPTPLVCTTAAGVHDRIRYGGARRGSAARIEIEHAAGRSIRRVALVPEIDVHLPQDGLGRGNGLSCV